MARISIAHMRQAYTETPIRRIPAGAEGTISANTALSKAIAQKMTITANPFARAVSFLSCSTFLWYRSAKYTMNMMCAIAKHPICAIRLTHDPK
jgi:hypothetical protein